MQRTALFQERQRICQGHKLGQLKSRSRRLRRTHLAKAPWILHSKSKPKLTLMRSAARVSLGVSFGWRAEWLKNMGWLQFLTLTPYVNYA